VPGRLAKPELQTVTWKPATPEKQAQDLATLQGFRSPTIGPWLASEFERLAFQFPESPNADSWSEQASKLRK
jgi:hypothetical protein